MSLAALGLYADVSMPCDWSVEVEGKLYRSENQNQVIEEYAAWTHRAEVAELVAEDGEKLPLKLCFEFEGSMGNYLKGSGRIENNGTKRLAITFNGPIVAPWKVERGKSAFYYPFADGWRIQRFPSPDEVKTAEKGKCGQFWTVREDGKVFYKNRYDCDYPSRQMTMQYVALSNGKETWSYAVKDAAFGPKQPLTEYDPEKSELKFYFAQKFVLEPGESCKLPRVEVLKRKGDWQVAALDYGEWFKKNVKRAEVPDFVRDSPSFPLVICKQQNGKVIWPFTEFDKLADALEAHGANQIQILGRGPGGHDHLYPDYTPDPAMGGRDALVKGLKTLKERGIRSYAYVNGQLIEQEKTAWWRDEGGKNAGVMKADGTRYGESWWKYKNKGEKAHSFDVGCPLAPVWMKRLKEIALDAAELGFDGLYVDQVGKQRPMFCCASDHAHPAGAWVFAKDRQRLLEGFLKDCREKNPEFVIETEGYCEPCSTSCAINLGLAYILDGVGKRFNADEWIAAWPEMAFLVDPDYITSDRFASPTRTRREVNAAAAVGYRLDLEVRYATDRVLFEKCEHTDYTEYTEEVVDPPWDFSPPFDRADFPKRDLKGERSYIKSVNDFRLKYRDILLRGVFHDELGFKVKTDAKAYTAKRWTSLDGLKHGVLVWNGDEVPRSFELEAPMFGYLTEVVEPGKGKVSAPDELAANSLRLYVFEERPESVSIVGPEWKFTRTDDPKASEKDFDDSAWQTVSVPHDWAITGPFSISNDFTYSACAQELRFEEVARTGRTGALPWTGVSWYRGKFTIPEGVGNASVKFDGVMNECKVWIDGKEVAESVNGYFPFVAEAPSGAGEHSVAVRIKNINNSMRWYPGAGLIRPVWLVTGPALGLAMDGTYVYTAHLAEDGSARLSVTEQVRGCDRKYPVKDLVVKWRVLDAEGEELEIETDDVSVADGVANGTITVKEAPLWSPDEPNLVKLVSELRYCGDLLDWRETRFGIRTVALSPEGLLINGEVTEIKGAGLHSDLGSIGAVFNPSAFRRQLKLLKTMGCNSIRGAHNPQAPDALSICDEEGVLVMEEAFDMWKSAKVGNGYAKYFQQRGEKDFERFIRLYRNHPSIYIWSIGNEIWEQDVRDTVTIGAKLLAIAKRVDPSRPVTQCTDRPSDFYAGYLQQLDMVCQNYRVGWDPNEAWCLGASHKASKSGLVIISEGASQVSSRGVYKFEAPVDYRSGGKKGGGYEEAVKYSVCQHSS